MTSDLIICSPCPDAVRFFNHRTPGPALAVISICTVVFSWSKLEPGSSIFFGPLYGASLMAIALQDRGRTAVYILAAAFSIAFAFYFTLVRPPLDGRECQISIMQAAFLFVSLLTSYWRAKRLAKQQQQATAEKKEKASAPPADVEYGESFSSLISPSAAAPAPAYQY